ncbi:MAG: MORN repeat-containing protein, partial [Deltaproteobacteria bacterium]|nr:MORN repeat-containing protein [Deltaproteobacteria bacterium]
MRKTLAVIIVLIIFSAISPCNGEQIEDGYFKATLPDSSIYEGYFKGGLFNGHGILVWRDG